MKKLMCIAILIPLLMSCNELCYSQLTSSKESEKIISTEVDTMTITAKSVLVSITITNESNADTLQFKTNNSSDWRTLYPQEIFPLKAYAKKLYRKTLSGSAYSRAWAD